MNFFAKCAIVFITVALLGLSYVNAEDTKQERFIGAFTLDEILSHSKRYEDAAFIYIPDADAVEVFRAVTKPVTIKLFYRTDCADSILHVPRFIKTIQVAANDLITVEAVGVDKGKGEPHDLVKGWNIERVPTFIVLDGDTEIGRVIETPEVSIDVDLAQILSQLLE